MKIFKIHDFFSLQKLRKLEANKFTEDYILKEKTYLRSFDKICSGASHIEILLADLMWNALIVSYTCI